MQDGYGDLVIHGEESPSMFFPSLSWGCAEEWGHVLRSGDRCGDPWNQNALFVFYLYTYELPLI